MTAPSTVVVLAHSVNTNKNTNLKIGYDTLENARHDTTIVIDDDGHPLLG